MVQELKDEHMKTGETLFLWQEYTHLSDRCSLHLQTLWHQWEELSTSSPQQDKQAVVRSVEVSLNVQSSVSVSTKVQWLLIRIDWLPHR